MKKTVIVHGPQGCGKTLHASKLASFFGLSIVIDEVEFGSCRPLKGVRAIMFDEVAERWRPIPELNALALSNVEPPASIADGMRVLTFDQAMTLAGLKRSGVTS